MATVVVIFEGDASIPPDMLWGTVRDLLVTAGGSELGPALEGVAWRMGTLDGSHALTSTPTPDEEWEAASGHPSYWSNTDYSGPFPNEGE